MIKHIVLVEDTHFKANLSVFTNLEHCKVTKTIIEDDMFKEDAVWLDLMKDKKKAEKALRDYEFDKRHNFKK